MGNSKKYYKLHEKITFTFIIIIWLLIGNAIVHFY